MSAKLFAWSCAAGVLWAAIIGFVGYVLWEKYCTDKKEDNETEMEEENNQNDVGQEVIT